MDKDKTPDESAPEVTETENLEPATDGVDESNPNAPAEVTEAAVAETESVETEPTTESSEPEAAVPAPEKAEQVAEELPGGKTEEAPSEKPEDAPVDLSALQGFDFGTSWSETKKTSGPSRTQPRGGSGRSDRRRSGPPSDRKDRRPFKPGSFRKHESKEGKEKGGGHHQRSFDPSRRFGGRPEVPRQVIEVSFYPEDNGFKAICKALRSSAITYELFDIARTILEKDERFYVVIRSLESAKEGEKKEGGLFVSVSDGMPFLTQQSATQHALADCLDHFFSVETKEVEPPSGSFSSVQKCGITGELLGPPNYHRLKKILVDHHSSRLSNMPYAKFESRIESVKDEEVIAEWIEKMKTQTSYTLKAEFGEPREFEDGETARAFVRANMADKLVHEMNSVRLEGTQISKVKDHLIKANLEFAWEKQKRFPLESANLLRGRLRRQKFALYKKGSKGVSYVCAVKRRFREPGESFSAQVQQLIEFLELHPNISVKELPEKILGFPTHAPEGEPPLELSADQESKFKAMLLDFQWLLKEGYISEYSNGTVFANPVASLAKGNLRTKVVPESDAISGTPVEGATKEALSSGEEVEVTAPAEIVKPSEEKSSEEKLPEEAKKESEEIESKPEPVEESPVLESESSEQPETEAAEQSGEEVVAALEEEPAVDKAEEEVALEAVEAPAIDAPARPVPDEETISKKEAISCEENEVSGTDAEPVAEDSMKSESKETPTDPDKS